MSDFLKPRAVIFDLDGTLLDTFPAIVAAWNAAMEPLFGRSFDPQEVVSHFGPPDEGMLYAAFPPALSPQEQGEAIERYYGAYKRAHENIEPFVGIETLLDYLKGKAIPLGVMTGKGRRSCDETLKFFGWTERFGCIVTGDEVAEPKPNPDGVLRVARELGIAPQECVFVGDSPADIGAAENAEMFSVVAGWHDYYFDELKKLNPDLWPQSPLELQEWLEGRLA
ncbi:pyrophosphatase PpaX [Abditibacteriota bacterium]|nr:pyrophosphatase PpaX [Abditibacteriota bacterium]